MLAVCYFQDILNFYLPPLRPGYAGPPEGELPEGQERPPWGAPQRGGLGFFDSPQGFPSRGSLVPYPTFSPGATFSPGEGLGAAAPDGFFCPSRHFQDLDNNVKEL